MDKAVDSLLDEEQQIPARLELDDGKVFPGWSFGFQQSVSGEVVFNTAMVGYPESLTDPSYCGQILILTYPLVGNYGVPSASEDKFGIPLYFESDRIQVQGLVIADYSPHPSHFKAQKSLGEWLKEHKVPAICGVDTRALTKHIRNHGSTLGWLLIGSTTQAEIPLVDPNLENLMPRVSRKQVQEYYSHFWETKDPAIHPEVHIVAVDCGMKNNILRQFLTRLDYRIKLTVVPWDHPFGDMECDGVFLSNGPSNPVHCQITIENIRKIMARDIPIFGICLGNQLLALAVGAKTYKMKFGNRGANQPVIDTRTTRCYITPQNHGYAVDGKTLPSSWKEFFVNANDKTNEGIIHKSHRWMSVQFHPEASGGPTDTFFLFHDFLTILVSPTKMNLQVVPISFPITVTKVIILGSGGLSIGQAGEFDYSGSQCIKGLRESSIWSVLINPNIATVQTGLAEKTYYLPVTAEFVTEVIKKEKPDAILCTFGGQTALNCAVELHNTGVLEEYNVRILGTPIEAIIATEDRDMFANKLKEIGEKCAESYAATTVEEAKNAAAKIGYPVLVRGAYCLGGLGSGFAENEEMLVNLARDALHQSPQVLVDKSLKGWKEIEYEVVRDVKDNCITVCNMENFDPLGIHTGDSIVIAPSQTLTNEEYYRLREVSLKVIRSFGIVGECNIQFALDPYSSNYCIVEVNARLSRSSALASKATGYPLAYIATKLALGYDLLTLRNQVTKVTTACFEPALDYCVVKIPRWDLKKFDHVDSRMGSSMKSVGEVMSIGRTFEESIQKAIRMVTENGATGFSGSLFPSSDKHSITKELENPSPTRIFAIKRAFETGFTVDRIHELSKIDRWFLFKLHRLHCLDNRLARYSLQTLDLDHLKKLKVAGFSDKQIADGIHSTDADVRSLRKKMGITPVVKQIDTLAAEFPSRTNYLYCTYQGDSHCVKPFSASCESRAPVCRSSSASWMRSNRPDHQGSQSLSSPNTPGLSDSNGSSCDPFSTPIVVLGCGCYRIGSSVEFDWSAMSCVQTLRSLGYPAVVINCNPETVSTDYDESDRLYFEDLSAETVLDIWEFEQPYGIIISVGGQVPNTLALKLHNNGVKILGTSVSSIDKAEDRHKFSSLCDKHNIDQPEWAAFTSLASAMDFCERVRYPVLVRPSYVLSGAAMRVVSNVSQLDYFINEAAVLNREHPVVISKFIENAKEVEIDAVAESGEILNYAISEHIQNAGVHSGDASLVLPAQKLYMETFKRIRRIAQKIANALKISGPFNIQFMCKQNQVKVIECNLRASRTFPFISKTLNLNFIEQATRVMVKAPVHKIPVHSIEQDFVGVKCPVFSFTRLRGADPVLGVEMRSTGEVACFGPTKEEAFLKAFLSTGVRLPKRSILLSIGPLAGKVELEETVEKALEMQFTIYATHGTYGHMMKCFGNRKDVTNEIRVVSKVQDNWNENEPPLMSAVDVIEAEQVDLIINIPLHLFDPTENTAGYRIRRSATDHNIPLLTDVKTALTLVNSLYSKRQREKAGKVFWDIRSWDDYVEMSSPMR